MPKRFLASNLAMAQSIGSYAFWLRDWAPTGADSAGVSAGARAAAPARFIAKK